MVNSIVYRKLPDTPHRQYVRRIVAGYWLLMSGSRDMKKGSTVVRRGLGVMAMVYGVALLFGALAGRSDPLPGGRACGAHGPGRRARSGRPRPVRRCRGDCRLAAVLCQTRLGGCGRGLHDRDRGGRPGPAVLLLSHPRPDRGESGHGGFPAQGS